MLTFTAVSSAGFLHLTMEIWSFFIRASNGIRNRCLYVFLFVIQSSGIFFILRSAMIPLSKILPCSVIYADSAGFYCIVVSGGGFHEPGCRAAGRTALQSAMEDPVQAHEH